MAKVENSWNKIWAWINFVYKHFFTAFGFSLLVQNLCTTLRKSLWETRGKDFRKLWKAKFYTKSRAKLTVSHSTVEKFYYCFCTQVYRLKTYFYTLSTDLTTITTKYL